MNVSTKISVAREAGQLLLCTLIATVATYFFHPHAPVWYSVQEPLREDEVTLEIIAQRWQNNVLWIDARPCTQYAVGHALGALLLNEEAADQLLLEHFEKLQDNTKPIIVYCGLESCQASRKIAQYLKDKLPTTQIYVLHGGWNEWKKFYGDRVTSENSP